MGVVIRLHNMVFYGYHGVFLEEQQLGQRFEVDVEIQTKEPSHDDLSEAVNYAEVYRLVAEIATTRRYNLIESLAQEIAQEVSTRFAVEGVTVRVRKPSVPLGGVIDYVEVEVRREAQE